MADKPVDTTLWHVESYGRDGTPKLFLVLSVWDALRKVEECLADETVGGVVAYRPPGSPEARP